MLDEELLNKGVKVWISAERTILSGVNISQTY